MFILLSRYIFTESLYKMRSSYDTYSSTSSYNSKYASPSSHLDLTPLSHGSERAEFLNRYQNRVKLYIKLNHTINFLSFSMHG